MMAAPAEIDEYLSSPIGRYHAGRCFAHVFLEVGVCATILWGRPDRGDVVELCAAVEVELPDRSPAHVGLVDARRLAGVDPIAFQVLADYIAPRNERFAANVAAQAIIRARGLPGAVVTGFYGATVPLGNTQVFDDPLEAVRWLGREDGAEVIAALDAIYEAEADVAPVVRRLRALLAGVARTSSLHGVARSLGLSARTLQEQLQRARTSFRAELTAARIREAERLLVDTDDKVTSIALEVGFASLQHFSTQFRKATGMPPAAFRSAARRR